MAIEILIPRIGWSMEKGVFSEWLKRDGDRIEPGDSLFCIEADKAVEEVASEDAGILRVIPARAIPGEELLVGTVIGYLVEPGEEIPEDAANRGSEAPAASPATQTRADTPGRDAPAPVERTSTAPPPRLDPGIVRPRDEVPSPAVATGQASSPRARRASRELAVSLRDIEGTGKAGRIVERDVVLAAAGIGPGPADDGSRGQVAPSGYGRPAPVSTIRIAVDVTELVGLMERMRQRDEASPGGKGRYQGLLAKLATAAYARAIPGDARDSAIEIAYGFPGADGIVYRAIRGVNRRSLGEIALDIEDPEARGYAAGGSEAFALIDLGLLGIDEYRPGDGVPSGFLVCVGRISGTPTGHSAGPQAWNLGVSLSFTDEHGGIVRAARFLEMLGHALSEPLLWLA